MLPAIDSQGKILMASPFEMKLAPNGNGAFYDAVQNNRQVQDHIKMMEFVQVIGVDNILNKLLDPIQLGFSAINNFCATSKTCCKRNAAEKVGVVAKKDGKYAIVEYSELSESHATSVNENGDLTFRHGNLLMFVFNAKTLLEFTSSDKIKGLYHKAHKKVDFWDF